VLLTADFWRAAGVRALYTVLAAALPLVAPLVGVPDVRTVLEALVALAFVAVASLATSLANLPELGGGRSHAAAVIDRIARSFFQVLAAALAAAVTFGDVDWATLLVQAAAAALVTAIRVAIAALPEDITAAPTTPDDARVITAMPEAPWPARGARAITPSGDHGEVAWTSTSEHATTAALIPDDPANPTWYGPAHELRPEEPV
jgi:hypothetical protein